MLLRVMGFSMASIATSSSASISALVRGRLRAKLVRPCSLAQVAKSDIDQAAGGVLLKDVYDDGCPNRIKRFVIRTAYVLVFLARVLVAQRGHIDDNAIIAQLVHGIGDFLFGHPGVVLSKHAVNVHVQGTSAGIVIGGSHKLDVTALANELGDNGVVGLVAAEAIPRHADDTGKAAVIQQLHQLIEFRSGDPVPHFTGLGEGEFRIFFEARV